MILGHFLLDFRNSYRNFSKTVVWSTGTVERQTGFINGIFLLLVVESHVCILTAPCINFALKVWQKKNVYIINVKISVYLTKKLRKYCLKVEYTRNPVRQSMRCYGLFLPSLRSHHYCEVTAVPRIHFSKTSRKWKKNLPQSLMPLWNISRWGMKPTTRTRTRAQNPLSDFLRWPNVTCNNFILDFWAYLYDALHKQCLV